MFSATANLTTAGPVVVVVVVSVVATTPKRPLVLSVLMVKVLIVVEVVSSQHSTFAQPMGLSVQNPTLQVVFHASLLVTKPLGHAWSLQATAVKTTELRATFPKDASTKF